MVDTGRHRFWRGSRRVPVLGDDGAAAGLNDELPAVRRCDSGADGGGLSAPFAGGPGLGVASAAVTAGWCALAASALAAWLPGAGGGAMSFGPLAAALPALCRPTGAIGSAATIAAVGGWAAMTAAMMLPCALPAWRALALGADRRGLAILAGFFGVWLVFGAALLAVVVPARAADAIPAPAVPALAALALAQRLGLAWRDRRRGPTGPAIRATAAPRRPRPDPSGLALGAGYGARCLPLEGPAMAICALSGAGGLATMALAAVLMLASRLSPGPSGHLAGAAAVVVLATGAI